MVQFILYSTEWIELLFWTVWVSDLHQYWFLSAGTLPSDSQNLHSKPSEKKLVIMCQPWPDLVDYTRLKAGAIYVVKLKCVGKIFPPPSADMIPSEWVQFNSIIFTGYYIISILTPSPPPHIYSNEKVKQGSEHVSQPYTTR